MPPRGWPRTSGHDGSTWWRPCPATPWGRCNEGRLEICPPARRPGGLDEASCRRLEPGGPRTAPEENGGSPGAVAARPWLRPVTEAQNPPAAPPGLAPRGASLRPPSPYRGPTSLLLVWPMPLCTDVIG